MFASRAPAAGAATESSLRAQAAALASRLDHLTRQEARADEQYNQARSALASAQAREASARSAAARAAADVARKRSVLRTAAVSAYMGGGHLSAMQTLIQSSAAAFAVQQGYLQSVVDTQQSAVDALRQAQARLTVQQTRLSQATAAARGQVARAASLRSELQSTAAAETSALAHARGQLARLVAQDQAEAAAKAAAATRARILAEVAAAQHRAGNGVSRDNPLPSPLSGTGSSGLAGLSGSGSGASGLGAGDSPPAAPAPSIPSSGPPAGPTSGPVAGPASGSGSGAAAEALRYAESVLGRPYVYGAAGPNSFDCSGLVMWAFAKAGISLPHSASAQWSATTRVSYADLRPGDLVFFYSPIDHVGIYVGNGQMIDAPHTGASVEYDSIWWGNLDGFGRVG